MRRVVGSVVVAAAVVALLGAGGASSATAFHWTLVKSGFVSPVNVTSPVAGSSRLYVVERAGRILVLVNGALQATPFLDITSLVGSTYGEQGLLSVAFHPRYPTNHRFYVDYTDKNGDTRVAEYTANSSGTQAILSSRRQLFWVPQPYANHNGGQLAFGPDGYLYIGMGDGGSAGDPENRAQNLHSLLGKLLRIDATTVGAKPQIVGYGLRNPWRFSFDKSTGDLYIGDVGQGSYEEIDYLPKSHPALMNFGWSRYEGYSVYDASRQLQGTGTVEWPVKVYGHSVGCAVVGGFVYRGTAIPAAQGVYFYGDYCTGHIWTFKIVNGKATNVTLTSQNLGRLSSFGDDHFGNLYVLTYDGSLYKLAAG